MSQRLPDLTTVLKNLCNVLQKVQPCPTQMHGRSQDSNPSPKTEADPKPQSAKNTSVPRPKPSSLHDEEKRRTFNEHAVPASRVARGLHFGKLMASVGAQVATEATKRKIGLSSGEDEGTPKPLLATEGNFERIAGSLSRLRGAALKLGQMISIQDEELIPGPLSQLLSRLRNNADSMPFHQVNHVLTKNFGPDWRSRFLEFDEVPIAAASIGQVHKAIFKDGRVAAIKIQYPGVRESIHSDVDNLSSLLYFTGLLPKGMYLERTLEVTKSELILETDYLYEANAQIRMKELLEPYPSYYVPTVYMDFTTKEVLSSEFVRGASLDQIVNYDVETRNWVSLEFMKLTLLELFSFHYMQTDPNWANFLWNPESQKLILLDFGATRAFPAPFIADYLEVVAAAAQKDRAKILSFSRKLGFLTGEESQLMNDAHCDAVTVLGLPFSQDVVFDFESQQVTKRIHSLIPTMLRNRLTPPPQESYSLHRKLSGAFLICAKLNANIPLYNFFWSLYKKKERNTRE